MERTISIIIVIVVVVWGGGVRSVMKDVKVCGEGGVGPWLCGYIWGWEKGRHHRNANCVNNVWRGRMRVCVKL